MKLKLIALAVAVAFSTPAFAAITATNSNTTFNSTTEILSALTKWKDAWSSVFSKENLSTTYFEVNALNSDSFKYLVATYSVPSAPKLSQSFSSFGAKTVTTFNMPTAVPGPEAGAGIGALAMGGLALYVKRRRQGAAIAA
ncbi:hypothetical protein [Oryzifoliimicrobium ureilyticus]|uniref:hypothetical protein n=1 Tax=Oryzifoliimicrobium ureilyticus TaxID=3113724 RepID=UPI0030761EB6